jgi:hypothetical protein
MSQRRPPACLRAHLRQVDTDRQTEKAMQPPHPFRVAVGQVVVDRHDMHALAGQRIQVGRPAWRPASCLRRCAFRQSCRRAGPCRRSVARRSGACRGPVCRLRARPRRLPAAARPASRPWPRVLEFDRLAAQLFVGQRADTFFQRVDLADNPRVLLDQPIIAAAENLFE